MKPARWTTVRIYILSIWLHWSINHSCHLPCWRIRQIVFYKRRHSQHLETSNSQKSSKWKLRSSVSHLYLLLALVTIDIFIFFFQFLISNFIQPFSSLATPRFVDNVESGSKLFGSNETTIERYPYQCQLRHGKFHICGCSVLTTTRALTAAHCIDNSKPPSSYSIKAGSTYRADNGDPNAQIRTLSRFIRHPRWGTAGFQGDVAVVYFVRPLTFGATVRPITLAPPNYKVPYGALATTTGWGIINSNIEFPLRLRVISTPIWTNVRCSREFVGYIFPDMICSGKPGQSSCSGDSGGPLVVGGVQIGVVSFGGECGKKPGVYARVPFYVKWIRDNM